MDLTNPDEHEEHMNYILFSECGLCKKHVDPNEMVVIDDVKNVSVPNCVKCSKEHKMHRTCFLNSSSFKNVKYGKNGEFMCPSPNCESTDFSLCGVKGRRGELTKKGGKRKTTKKRKTNKKRKSYRKK